MRTTALRQSPIVFILIASAYSFVVKECVYEDDKGEIVYDRFHGNGIAGAI
jgi:hypothetical protein